MSSSKSDFINSHSELDQNKLFSNAKNAWNVLVIKKMVWLTLG
jgi:hypothetical protein